MTVSILVVRNDDFTQVLGRKEHYSLPGRDENGNLPQVGV